MELTVDPKPPWGKPQASADERVGAAELVWHPGSNSGGPNARSKADGEAAVTLAHLVNATPRVPECRVNCPADSGSNVVVTFHPS